MDLRVCLNQVKVMEKEKLTALYCRISREDELTNISSSIETQKAYLKRYANQHHMINTKYYIDDGYSGTNFDRPGFSELQEDIENNLVGIVITKDLSRLGRDYLSTGYYIEHYFPMNSVRYIAINDQVDTLLNENDFVPFRNIINEWYARDISKKIRSAYHTKALNGEFTGPYPPYGYSKHQENKHTLIINPEQSEIVRKIYNLFIDGNSIYKIAKILKQDEILTPRAEMFLSHGTNKSVQITQYPFDWSNKTILNILENEEYTGSVICNRHQTISFKSKKLIKNPSNKWIVSKNMHEPIINLEMYMQVQDIIHQNKKAPSTKHTNIFKGKVRCNTCGKTLTLSVRPGRQVYGTFDCSTYRRYGKSRCISHYVTYEQLTLAVITSINKIISIAQKGEGKLDNYILKKNSPSLQTTTLKNCTKEKEQRIDEIDVFIKKLYENYVFGKIKEDKFYVLDKNYDDERKSIIKEIKDIQNQISEINKYEEKAKSFIRMISKFDQVNNLNQDIIDKLIEKMVVTEDKDNKNIRIVDIYYSFVGRL